MRTPRIRIRNRNWAALVTAACIGICLAPGLAAQDWQGAAAIAVRVTGEDGQPIADAQVVARVSDADDAGPPPTPTDAGGRAIVSGLRDGEWFVEVSHPGYMLYAAYVNLRAGKKPVVGFSSQVNTATSWSPMTVKFLKASADFRRTAPPKRAERKPPEVVREPPPSAPPPPVSVVRPEPEPPKVVRPQATPEAEEPTPEPEPDMPADESTTDRLAEDRETPEIERQQPAPATPAAEPQTTEPATSAADEPLIEVPVDTPVETPVEPADEIGAEVEAAAELTTETVAVPPSPAEEVTGPTASTAVIEPDVDQPPIEDAPAAESIESEIAEPVVTESQPSHEPPVTAPKVAEAEPEAPVDPELPVEPQRDPTPQAETVIAESPPAELPQTEAEAPDAPQTSEPAAEVMPDADRQPEESTQQVPLEPTMESPVESQPVEPQSVEPQPGPPGSASAAAEPEEAAAVAEEALPEDRPTEAPAPSPEPTSGSERIASPPAAPSPGGSTPSVGRLPRFLRSAAAGTCSECEPGEWAVAAEQEAARAGDTPATSACTEEYLTTARNAAQQLADASGARLDGYVGPVLTAMFRLEAGSGRDQLQDALGSVTDPESNCQLAGIVLPPGTSFSGYVLEAWDNLGGRGCRAGMTCAVGRARWLDEPQLVVGSERTVVYGIFKNRSTRRARRLRMTIYFKPDAADWSPRTR